MNSIDKIKKSLLQYHQFELISNRNKYMNDNNLIAEFMGWQLQDNPKDRWYGSYREPNGILHKNTNKEPMQFHSSWDWLMPVVAKCRQESNPEDSHWEKIYYSLEDTDIDVTYSSVVEFIKNQKL